MEDTNNNSNENKELSSHEKKELKKKQKEEVSQNQTHESKKESKSKTVKYGVTALIVLLIIFGGYYLIIKPINEFKPFTSGPVHWHANFRVSLCGIDQDFTTGYDFEENRLGSIILHSHNDNVVHMEGQIAKVSDITLGNFFDSMRVQFSPEQIMDKRNGDLCPDGQPGSVHMYVNGKESNKFRDFTFNPCDSKNIKEDCDKIEIKFE